MPTCSSWARGQGSKGALTVAYKIKMEYNMNNKDDDDEVWLVSSEMYYNVSGNF